MTRLLTLAVATVAACTPTVVDSPSYLASYEGTIEISVAEDFDTGSEEQRYVLDLGSGRYVEMELVEPRRLLAGTRVSVNGRVEAGGRLIVEPDALTLLDTPIAFVAGSPRPSLAVVRFTHRNKRQRIPDGQIEEMMRGRVGPYYRDASYGVFQAFERVAETSWIEIDQDNTNCDDYQRWAQEARDRLEAMSPGALNGFDYVMYWWPRTDACWWGGRGLIGGTTTWINGSTDFGLLNHELGHNFGAWHAGSCNGFRLTGPGAATDSACDGYTVYADAYDVMGYSNGHPSTVHKLAMGFAPRVEPVTASRTVTLATLESAPAAAPQAIELALANGKYVVEYRVPGSGYVPAVQIRYTQGLGVNLGCESTCDTALVRSMKAGERFTDVRNQVTLDVTRMDVTADVRIAIGEAPTSCRAPTSVGIEATTRHRKRRFAITIANNDVADVECAAGRRYQLTFRALSGRWRAKPGSITTAIVAPGTPATVEMKLWPVEDSSGGPFAIDVVSVDAAGVPDGLYSGTTLGYYEPNEAAEPELGIDAGE